MNYLEMEKPIIDRRQLSCSSFQFVEGNKLKESLESKTPRLLIPRIHLFGIQTREEYDGCKRSSVERRLAQQGINYLNENPILVCAIPNKNIQLFIIDGHHRARYSGKFRISNLPCLIATPEQVIDALRENGDSNPLSTDALVQDLIRASAETLSSFKQIATGKQPRVVPGINSIKDLERQFACF